MQNPSPYDSGYDSSFSTASGPGNPPSSRGNSDIDDQFDRYICEQRVATIVQSTPEPMRNNLHATRTSRHSHHLDTNRAIAAYHHALANDPDFDEPPPLIPDSDTDEDEDEPDDGDITPTLTQPVEDTQPNIATTRNQPIPSPTPPAPTDDEQNHLRRTYHPAIHHQPHRNLHGTAATYDVRTATQDSDSTPIYPDATDSDEEYPGYWPEQRALTPPLSISPPVTTLSDQQLADWVLSQLPWHAFRKTLPELRDTPDYRCGPPNIPRLYPPPTNTCLTTSTTHLTS